MGKPALNSFWTRLISGTVLFITVCAAILLSPYTFAALIVVICVGCLREFYALSRAVGAEPQNIYGMILGGALVGVNSLLAMYIRGPIVAFSLLIVLLLIFSVFAIELYRKRENPILNVSTTLAGILYIAVPFSILAYISTAPITGGSAVWSNFNYYPWTVLCFIFIIWANDIGAYLVGVAIGKHKLFERISPKKSWEGFFGGLVAAVGIGALTGWLSAPEGVPAVDNIIIWGGLSLVTVLSGVLGDLVESMFKRSVGVKDSGSVMPGHGGMLDRFDAMIYSIPFVFVYLFIFHA